MENAENITSIQTQLPDTFDPSEPKTLRAALRDLYIETFNRSFILERMAKADFSIGIDIYGRIEVVEWFALDLGLPAKFILNKEEQHYYHWLKDYIHGKSGDQLLRDQFLHGMSTKAPLGVYGAVA